MSSLFVANSLVAHTARCAEIPVRLGPFHACHDLAVAEAGLSSRSLHYISLAPAWPPATYRGFTGHVAQPARSIRSRMLANEALESVLPHGASGSATTINRDLSALTHDLARLTAEWESVTAAVSAP